MRLALFTLVLLAVSAVAAAAEPPGPAPEHSSNAPPPAWISTHHAAHWLAYSSYCWNTGEVNACADMVAPHCSDSSVPKIRVHKRERVRLHLGFTPSEVTVDVNGRTRELRAVRNPAWRVRRRGVLFVFTRAAAGDASYVACLRVTRAP